MAGSEDIPKDDATTNGDSSKPSTPHSKSGWDGKLRVNKQATVANPEALDDPDYSDEDAPPPDQIEADEDLLAGEDPDVEASTPNSHCTSLALTGGK
ncbi:protein phosphatase regulatory subunit Sds22 [Teratosphaeriaceae sp. CCFEE 6253]|nr:protein phosphatase regulatory subunit Sds22 [Teratosphaeriaceae sp. CCFEE 6253]